MLIVDSTEGMRECDSELIRLFTKKEIPYIIAFNKTDLLTSHSEPDAHTIFVSTVKNEYIYALKKKIAGLAATQDSKLRIVGDLIHPSDFVVLVTPIDKAAPKGRLILPQQQTIRDILETDATAVIVKEYELRETLKSLGKPPRTRRPTFR